MAIRCSCSNPQHYYLILHMGKPSLLYCCTVSSTADVHTYAYHNTRWSTCCASSSPSAFSSSCTAETASNRRNSRSSSGPSSWARCRLGGGSFSNGRDMISCCCPNDLWGSLPAPLLCLLSFSQPQRYGTRGGAPGWVRPAYSIK